MEIINPLSSYEDAIKDHHLESLEKETKKMVIPQGIWKTIGQITLPMPEVARLKIPNDKT